MGTGAVSMRPRVVARASPSPSPSPSPSSKPSPSSTTTTRGGVSIRFERCRREDLARVTAVERASYPADEAASATSLEMRQREAGEFFMVARAVDESMDSSGLERARALESARVHRLVHRARHHEKFPSLALTHLQTRRARRLVRGIRRPFHGGHAREVFASTPFEPNRHPSSRRRRRRR